MNKIEKNLVKEFLEDILKVYDKHKLSISHEDNHGSFLVEKDCDVNRKWIMSASYCAASDGESYKDWLKNINK